MLERAAFKVNGFVMLTLAIVLGVVDVGWFLRFAQLGVEPRPVHVLLFTLGLLAMSALFAGLTPVQPNQARAIVFLGSYVGTIRDAGFWWANPFATKQMVSLRTRNFQSEKGKVNDANGNPIEIAAVVTWEVVDSAKALFAVDAYERFVAIQAETSLRALAGHYPYDAHDEAKTSLRGSPEEVANKLREDLQTHLDKAGVHVIDARISHLAYAPEIAQAMLRRQQAQAVVAARQQIVEGAVGMVEMALKKLSERSVVHLDEERKAAMVSNLLVVLVGEGQVQPMVNAGTLY